VVLEVGPAVAVHEEHGVLPRIHAHARLCVGLTWTPWEHVSLGSAFNWTGNFSNNKFASYEIATPMIGLYGAFGF
jgi:hypothetical protein